MSAPDLPKNFPRVRPWNPTNDVEELVQLLRRGVAVRDMRLAYRAAAARVVEDDPCLAHQLGLAAPVYFEVTARSSSE